MDREGGRHANLRALMVALLTGSLLALALGVRHSIEPDHLAAVSTIVAERRGRRAAVQGAAWGLGHTVSLLAIGAVLLVLRRTLPARLDDVLEWMVALTLLLLGARAIRRAAQLACQGPVASHAHGGRPHVHAGPADHVHLAGWTLARRPLVVGLLHGLAGSGALTAIAMPTLGSGLWFLLCFGIGAMAGMALMCGLAGLALGGLFSRRGARWLIGGAGVLSLLLGLIKGWPLTMRLLS
jgi:hypothetical protein